MFTTDCAWGPAKGLMKKICELYPEIEFRCEWGEEQVTEYYGFYTYDKTNGWQEKYKYEIDVDEAYNMLDRLGLLIADQDDGYFPNHNTGLVDYDERLKSGYRNPTGFRRWVKVAKSRGCCYTCKHDRDVNAAKNILVEGLRQIA